MNKKKVLIILVIILVLAIIVAIMYFNNKAKYEYEIEKVTEINYHILSRNERYGVIDKQGNVIVEPIYDIIQIPNPSKPIFICMSDYDVEKKEYISKVLNERGEQLYQDYTHIQAIPNETTEDGIPFEKTVLKYKENGKYGLLNINGKKITDAEYDQITSMTYKEGMLIVKQGDNLGVININGKTVIDLEYATITADNYYNKETKYKDTGFIVSQKKEDGYKYGYINYKGKKILDTDYTEIQRVTEIQEDNNVYLVARESGQAGLLKNKKQILEHEYEEIRYNSYNDIFIVQRNGKQGVVSRQGKVRVSIEYDNILPGGIYINAEKNGEYFVLDQKGNKLENTDILSKNPTQNGEYYIISTKDEVYKITDKDGSVIVDKGYTYIEEIDDNHFIVANGRKNGIINIEGKALIDLNYTSIFKIEGTELLQANILSNNTVSLIDKNMNIVTTLEGATVKVKDDVVTVYSSEEYKYFDLTGKEISNKEVYRNNNLFAKEIDGKWGFEDKNGELKVQNEYEMVTEFNKHGFAGVKKDDKWGVIDLSGNIVQEPIYELEWSNPEFIGKFYKQTEWYGDSYFTDEVKED